MTAPCIASAASAHLQIIRKGTRVLQRQGGYNLSGLNGMARIWSMEGGGVRKGGGRGGAGIGAAWGGQHWKGRRHQRTLPAQRRQPERLQICLQLLRSKRLVQPRQIRDADAQAVPANADAVCAKQQVSRFGRVT